MCIHSGSVQTINTNYNIFFPKEEDRKLVILPNRYAPHDTFNGIPPEAVCATGLYIVPGTVGGESGLMMTIPVRGGDLIYRAVPLHGWLRVVGQCCTPERTRLPVLMNAGSRG